MQTDNSKIGATVDFYEVHVLYCAGADSHLRWSKNSNNYNEQYNELKKSYKSKVKDSKYTIKFSICDMESTASGDQFDVVCIKGGSKNRTMVRITLGITELDSLWAFIDNGKQSLQMFPLPLDNYIFVCCHDQKHTGCGTRGEAVHNEFDKQRRRNQIVHRMSHIGKEQYAAEVICYPSGDWYGNVSTRNVKQILDTLNAGSEPHSVLGDHWRGAMGMTKDEQIRLSSNNARIILTASSRPVKVLTRRTTQDEFSFSNQLLSYLLVILLLLALFELL